MHEQSNDGLSSRPTESSTPDSSSFWLPEYSEEEQERLGKAHPFMHFKTSAFVITFKAFLVWKENQDELCDGADEANEAPSRGKGKANDTPTRKRTSVDREPGKATTDGSEPSSSQTKPSKRRRTSDRKLTFACPYTKKDPMSHRECYGYTLSRIRDVKQHLARRHQKPLYCPRCMRIFENEGERDRHIREPTLCPIRPSITLDGITESQRQQLAKKSASNISEESQWFAVFDILFPGHGPRPESPYIDRELFQDITLYQDFLMTNGPRILSDVLTRRGAIIWNLPNEERDLSAFQQTVLEEGLHVIFNQWVARRGSNAEHLNIPGICNTLTPPSSDTSAEGAGSTSNQGPRDPFTVPGQEPTMMLAGTDAVQEASSNQNVFAGALEDLFTFEQSSLHIPQEFPYDGPDQELMNLMSDPQARFSFRPALD